MAIDPAELANITRTAKLADITNIEAFLYGEGKKEDEVSKIIQDYWAGKAVDPRTASPTNVINSNMTNSFDSGAFGVRNFQQDFRKNGNPIVQAGASQLQLPGERQALELPNAVLQKIAFEGSVNHGNVNVVDKYFGTAGNGQYVSRDVLKDYLNTITPQFAGSGSFDMNQANQARTRQLETSRQSILGNSGGAITERRDTQGGVTGGNVGQLNNINSEINSMSGVDPREAARRAADKDREAQAAMEKIRNMKATTSNLPISERVVK